MPSIPPCPPALERSLNEVFGVRLRSIVAYGLHDSDLHGEHSVAGGHGHASSLTHTVAIVETLTAGDLEACAAHVAAWRKAGLATPLFLAGDEFGRALDAFPYEFGSILAHHVVWFGPNPFEGLSIDPADLRRACEVQARSHLLHLREGYVETGGNADGLAVLIVDSAAPFAALVRSVARLLGSGGHDAAVAADTVERALALQPGAINEIVKLVGVREIGSAEAVRLFPGYLDAAEKLTRFIDRWNAA
jgi:hypothetical protein